jgi:small subunit ribosomal protein S6
MTEFPAPPPPGAPGQLRTTSEDRSNVRSYEFMVILDASLDEEAVRAVVERAAEALRAASGTLVRVDVWGKRRFAYEIAHRAEGTYVVVEVRGDAKAVADMDRAFSLADEVLRHRVVQLPDRVKGRSRPAPSPSGDAVAQAG